MSEPAPVARSFAEKFQHLIDAMHPEDRGPFTDAELAEVFGVSRQYIWQLRTGKRGERVPGAMLGKMASYFGVPVEYFTDDQVAARVDAEIEAVLKRRAGEPVPASGAEDAISELDPRAVEARRIAQRYLALSPEGQAAMSSLLDTLEDYGKQPRSTRSRRKPSSSTS